MNSFVRFNRSYRTNWKWVAPVLLLCLCVVNHTTHAQSLGYEGPTGVLVTPIASTSASPANGLGKPSIAYHFLAGGNVVGDFSTVSITEGFAKRFEVGYTSEIHAAGSSDITPLWNGDLSIVHGKANILPENFNKTTWVPAISVGAIGRFNDNYVGDGINTTLPYGPGFGNGTQTTRNADFYLVGTKVITQISKKVPVLISGGVRGTNAALWGLAGNAPNYKAEGFGTLALVFTGPSKSTIIVGAEVAQQPQQVLVDKTVTVPTSVIDIPTSEVFAARIVPFAKHKLNIDVGVLHAGEGGDDPVLNLRYRAAFGLSYGF
jgi:hypothetical protein